LTTNKEKIKFLILLLLWCAVVFPVVPEMVHDWSSHSDNGHGFLVPLITLYLIWQKRGTLSKLNIGTARLGGVLLAASLLLFVVSYAGGTAFPARIALVLSIVGLVWYCLGNEFIQQLKFPLLYLLFMIPVPYSLISLVSVPLQLIATTISAGFISFCSIPVLQEGNMLYFANTQLEVAEACSGIRSIMALGMLSTLFAYLSSAGLGIRLLFVLSAIPIALLGNLIRISGTGVLAHYFGSKVASGFLHELSGMVVFVFGLIVLFMLFSLMERKKSHDIK
jgi:exosortase A